VSSPLVCVVNFYHQSSDGTMKLALFSAVSVGTCLFVNTITLELFEI